MLSLHGVSPSPPLEGSSWSKYLRGGSHGPHPTGRTGSGMPPLEGDPATSPLLPGENWEALFLTRACGLSEGYPGPCSGGWGCRLAM